MKENKLQYICCFPPRMKIIECILLKNRPLSLVGRLSSMLFGIHVNFIHYSHYKIKLSTYVVLFIRVLVGVENSMLVKQL